MNTKELKDLYDKMLQVHSKVETIYEQGTISSMYRNEYNNKVSQYDGMYQSIEDMKAITDKEDTIASLINQQIEILNVRIKWELDWAKRAIG